MPARTVDGAWAEARGWHTGWAGCAGPGTFRTRTPKGSEKGRNRRKNTRAPSQQGGARVLLADRIQAKGLETQRIGPGYRCRSANPYGAPRAMSGFAGPAY